MGLNSKHIHIFSTLIRAKLNCVAEDLRRSYELNQRNMKELKGQNDFRIHMWPLVHILFYNQSNVQGIATLLLVYYTISNYQFFSPPF